MIFKVRSKPNCSMILYKDILFHWRKMFCWSAVAYVTLFSSQPNNLGRQNHILLAVETVSVGRNLILGGNSGKCFLLTGTGLHLGCRQVELGH